jgi:hypothetical protein
VGADALFDLLRAGADGVNVHVRYTVNAAFALARHGLEARPLLYGLALFTRPVTARSGETRDGQSLGVDGTRHGRPATQLIASLAPDTRSPCLA